MRVLSLATPPPFTGTHSSVATAAATQACEVESKSLTVIFSELFSVCVPHVFSLVKQE